MFREPGSVLLRKVSSKGSKRLREHPSRSLRQASGVRKALLYYVREADAEASVEK